MLWINLLIFIAALIVLVLGGSLMVRTLSKIAAFLHLSEYVIGFVVLAFATSIPELFVGIFSAINKTPELILGNVIGANIANLTYIIGIPVLLARGITIQSKKTKKDAFWMIGLISLPMILMIIGNSISRIDGIILLIAFFTYAYKLLREGKQFTKELDNKTSHKQIIIYFLLFLFSLGLLYFSSDYLVKYAQLLAIGFDIPIILIGLFMVAIGTSLPELVSGISAVVHKYYEMGVGNVMGSVVANSTLVLGVSALIYPITANFLFFIISVFFMMIVAIIFTAFVEKGDKLSWIEGMSLVLLYIFFLMIEFYLKGFV